jgi:integrase
MGGHGETGGPKSRAGRRGVPIVAALRDLLVEHKLITRRDSGLVFGSSESQPFTPTAVRKRALTAWRRASLEPIGLHECRHTFASLLIAAGVNPKAITAYLGHASIQTTFDLYGHLMQGMRTKRSHWSIPTSSGQTAGAGSGYWTLRILNANQAPLTLPW